MMNYFNDDSNKISKEVSSLFAYLSPKKHPASSWKTLTYNKGDVIYFPDKPSSGIYEIVYGAVRISHYSEGGMEMTADILSTADLFGNIKAISNNHAEHSRALTSLLLRKYDTNYFRGLQQHDPVVATWFNNYLLTRWTLLERKLFNRVTYLDIK